MAQKKGGGSTRNGRDSQPKMLGVKVFGGQTIPAAVPHCKRHGNGVSLSKRRDDRTSR